MMKSKRADIMGMKFYSILSYRAKEYYRKIRSPKQGDTVFDIKTCQHKYLVNFINHGMISTLDLLTFKLKRIDSKDVVIYPDEKVCFELLGQLGYSWTIWENHFKKEFGIVVEKRNKEEIFGATTSLLVLQKALNFALEEAVK